MRVGLRCDANPEMGVGHVMRCVALAEALVARGDDVVFLASITGVDWLAGQLPAPCVPGEWEPDRLVEQARSLELDAVVLDSYELDPAAAGRLSGSGVATLAVVDGDSRGQEADLFLDQNLGATAAIGGGSWLVGLRYALVRSAVTARRPPAPRPASGEHPRVLCVFGGTDTFGAASVAAETLTRTAVPLDATVITAGRPGPWPPPAAGQTLTFVDHAADLPALVAEAHLVVSASGTSTWDLLCLGVPTALLWVVDNQAAGYHRAVDAGLAIGVGHLDDLRQDAAPAVRTLREALLDPRARQQLGAMAWGAVDGQGADRVATALAAVAAARRPVWDRPGNLRDGAVIDAVHCAYGQGLPAS